MTCDQLGYQSLLELLALLLRSPVGSKRTFVLDKPDKWSASSSLEKSAELKTVFVLSPEEDAWNLVNEESKLIITIGVNTIKGLVSSVELAKSGEYDFSFGRKKGLNLWFW